MELIPTPQRSNSRCSPSASSKINLSTYLHHQISFCLPSLAVKCPRHARDTLLPTSFLFPPCLTMGSVSCSWPTPIVDPERRLVPWLSLVLLSGHLCSPCVAVKFLLLSAMVSSFTFSEILAFCSLFSCPNLQNSLP